MTARRARLLAFAYFALFAAAVTWPGVVPFNRIRPLVLGLPLSMAWEAFWIVGGLLVLWLVYKTEAREGGGPDGPGSRPPPDEHV